MRSFSILPGKRRSDRIFFPQGARSPLCKWAGVTEARNTVARIQYLHDMREEILRRRSLWFASGSPLESKDIG